MALLPDGRTDRFVIDAELDAATEFGWMLELYPEPCRPAKRRDPPTLRQLRPTWATAQRVSSIGWLNACDYATEALLGMNQTGLPRRLLIVVAAK